MNMKIDLPLNVPVAIALSSLAGVKVPSEYPPGSQFRFTDEKGRALYLPLDVGDRVRDLGSSCIRLTKAKPAHGGRIQWKVEPISGEQPNGTFVIPKDQTLDPANPHKQPTESGSALVSQVKPTLSEPNTARKRHLWDAGREFIDAHAALVKYASERHPGVLTSYDVRTYLVTAFIQHRNQAGGRR